MGPFPREFKSLSRRHTVPHHHNLHVRQVRALDVDPPSKPQRRWYALMALGILLHALCMMNSDLGLDSHVRLNAAMDETATGQDLAWGNLRVEDSTRQTPDDPGEYNGYIPPWFASETSVKISAFAGVLGVALLAGAVPKWSTQPGRFDPTPAALVLLSPIFLFVSGRGYDEGLLALIGGLGVIGFLFNQGALRHERLLHVLMMATTVLLLLGWKGFGMMFCLGAWALTLVVGFAWVMIEDGRTDRIGTWLRHPWKMGGLAAVLVLLAVFVVGFFGDVPTFRIVRERPLAYALATLTAAAHASIVFLLVGFMLWPMVVARWSSFSAWRGPGPTMVVVYATVLLAGISSYIGALWTLEASLWNRSLPETMLVLGNNGRYATAILLPLLTLLRWIEPSNPSSEGKEGRNIGIAAAALVPLMLFIALFGQQLWSDDAGAWLADITEEEECFLMVAPETLAMHHLYVIKSHVDLTGDRVIDAYWRTPGQAQPWLDGHPACAGLILVAPGAAFTPNTAEYTQVHTGDVPFTMSGGASDDGWQVFARPT